MDGVKIHECAVVDEGAQIGEGSRIWLFVHICGGAAIGSYAFIGAGAVVNKDVPDFALVVGVPGKQIGWMSRFGEQLELPLNGSGQVKCQHTGELYLLDEGRLSLKRS